MTKGNFLTWSPLGFSISKMARDEAGDGDGDGDRDGVFYNHNYNNYKNNN